MKEILSGGIALGPSSLNLWETVNTHVVSSEGYVYLIRPNGYMKQKKPVNAVVTELEFNILYSVNEPTECHLLVEMDALERIDIRIPLEVQQKNLQCKFPIGGAQVKYITLQILSGSNNVTVKQVSLQGHISVDSEGVSSDDFIKYSILYGTDINKPKMR